MSEFWIPVSPGELLDKMTILRIKADRIGCERKKHNVLTEYSKLMAVTADRLGDSIDAEMEKCILGLESVNEELWDVEDELRLFEAEGRFDKAFIELARRVYKLNDERSRLKNRINVHLNSSIREEKSYTSDESKEQDDVRAANA